ncbi:MAG: sugar O-acetyltransferase [Abditibacteriota bacterium]|nr:sugar O-acetyltransferase [Abditibacteriota bacterium]
MSLKDILAEMRSGELYRCDDPELLALQTAALEKVYDFNATRPSQSEERKKLIKDIFAEAGENCYIEPPLHANWGCFTHVGKNFYANFNLTLVDDTDIYIGDNVLIGPNVVLDAGTHPVAPEYRAMQYQYNLSVRIGDNVWIGANSVVLPGVTVGSGSIIGAGSVVTKDIPENVIAAGVPCKVLREITARDRDFYDKNRPVPDRIKESI